MTASFHSSILGEGRELYMDRRNVNREGKKIRRKQKVKGPGRKAEDKGSNDRL